MIGNQHEIILGYNASTGNDGSCYYCIVNLLPDTNNNECRGTFRSNGSSAAKANCCSSSGNNGNPPFVCKEIT